MGLLDSFLQPKPTDLLGLMEILGDLMHRLSVQVVGAISLKIAQHLLPLFEDVSRLGKVGWGSSAGARKAGRTPAGGP
jgi:hypothetical protein